MPKLSFKVFIILSFIVIIFAPILLVRTVVNLTDVLSSREKQTDSPHLWVQENILGIDKERFYNEEWKRQIIMQAEHEKVDLLIIFADGESLQTKGMKDPENYSIIESDKAISGNLYKLYYPALQHYNIYSDSALIASVYVSNPIPAKEQLKAMNYDFIIYLCAFVLVALFFIIFLQVNLIKPLRAINESSQHIANGTYNIRLPSSQIKEMNITTHAFIDMAKKLKMSKQANERLEEERKFFVSSIVHDVRTPIFSLRGFLEGLTKGIIKNEQRKREYLEMSMKQANHLNELVTALAKYATIEGEIKLEEIKLFPVVDLISDLKQMLVFNLLERDLTLQIQNQASNLVAGDYLLLRRAFENVLINCIRHSPRQEKIEVFINESEDFIETIIRDNGQGFVEKDIEHLFKPLYKGEQKSSSDPRMGLGLTIVQVIIQKHNGTIQASNDEEKGAKIVIKLPKNAINRRGW